MNKEAAKRAILAQIYLVEKLKHGPDQMGGPGPCEPSCRKCELEAQLKKLDEV